MYLKLERVDFDENSIDRALSGIAEEEGVEPIGAQIIWKQKWEAFDRWPFAGPNVFSEYYIVVVFPGESKN